MKRLIILLLAFVISANGLFFFYPNTAKAEYAPTAPPAEDSLYYQQHAGVSKAIQSVDPTGGLLSLQIETRLAIDRFYDKDRAHQLSYLTDKILANYGNTKLAAYKAIKAFIKSLPIVDESGIKSFSVEDSQANLKTLNTNLATYLQLWTQFYYDAKTFTKKCTWSQYDIDLLYSLLWPDLIANKPKADFTQEELNRLAAVLESPTMKDAIGQINQGKDLKEIWNQIWTKGNQLLLVTSVVGLPYDLFAIAKGGWGIISLLRQGKLIDSIGTFLEGLKSGGLLKGVLGADKVEEVAELSETFSGATQRFNVPKSKIFAASTLNADGEIVTYAANNSATATRVSNLRRLEVSLADYFERTEFGKSLTAAQKQHVFDNIVFLDDYRFNSLYKARWPATTDAKLENTAAFVADYFDGQTGLPAGKRIFARDTVAEYRDELDYAVTIWHEVLHIDQATPEGWLAGAANRRLNEAITEFIGRRSVEEAYKMPVTSGAYQADFPAAVALNNMLERRAVKLGLSGYASTIDYYHQTVGLQEIYKAFPEKSGLVEFFKYFDSGDIEGAIKYLNSLWN